jgi:hypothetical protein
MIGNHRKRKRRRGTATFILVWSFGRAVVASFDGRGMGGRKALLLIWTPHVKPHPTMLMEMMLLVI